MNQEELSDEDLIARALIAANKIIAENNKKIKQLKPKAEFADLVTASDGSIMIGEFAAILAKENIMLYDKRINRDSLFKWLREHNYLIKRKDLWNVPKKKYIERGLFEVEERIGNSGMFEDKVYTITLITPMGQKTI